MPKVLEVGFGEELLTRSSSPILPCLNANWCKAMNSLRLLQITDSAFPLGGYAFSSGLESMAHLGLIPDGAALVKYL